MRPRRFLAALFATLFLTGLVAGPASAGKPFTDESRSCADLFGGGATLFGTPDDATSDGLGASAEIATAPCRKGSYLLNVYSSDGQSVTSYQPTVAQPSDLEGTAFQWTIDVGPQPSGALVCVTITSHDMKGKVIDTIPDGSETGCEIGAAVTFGGGAGGWH